MESYLDRSLLLLGKAGIHKLQSTHITIYGVGGVGSFALEALVRSGISKFTLIDGDIVQPSNLNRQLIADINTIGLPKVDVAKQRILTINPSAEVKTYQMSYREDLDEKYTEELFQNTDYIADCIDDIDAKVHLIYQAHQKNIPIISAMGAGNKYDPTQFRVTDLAETYNCPVSRLMRKYLGRKGLRHSQVVYSPEKPQKPFAHESTTSAPGSLSFVPSVCGLILGGTIIKNTVGPLQS